MSAQRRNKGLGIGGNTQASCDVCICCVSCAVREVPAQSCMNEGWLHGWEDRAWPLSPRAGQLGTQAVEVHVWWAGAVLGRSPSPQEKDRLWALLSCEDDAWWQ